MNISHKNIIYLVTNYIKIDDIVFINAQWGKITSDVDIYCVADIKKSYVYIFKKDNRWYEIFIDSKKNFDNKILNMDEIVHNFLKMKLVYGDSKLCKDFKKKFPHKYYLPEIRLQKLMYRIEVINSKYKSASNLPQKKLFLGQLIPYLIMLEFHLNSVWPKSPKKWLDQLSKFKTSSSKQLIKYIYNNETNIDQLIYEYLFYFKGLNLKYTKINNTFIN